MARTKSSSQGGLALIAAGLFTLAAPPLARAQTAEKPRQLAPVLTGAFSLMFPLLPEMYAALVGSERFDENWAGIRASLYIGSGAGFAFAGTTFALEATTPGTCGKDCRGAYASAIVGTLLSTLGMGIAIGMTVSSPRKKRRAMVVPLVIPSETRPAIGVGVTGVTF